MLRHKTYARVLVLLVATVIAAVAIGHFYAHKTVVQAQSRDLKPWKVLAITPDAAGASALETELMKGGWNVQSVMPAQYDGARTLVVLKSRIITD
jgi:hypothetical protein